MIKSLLSPQIQRYPTFFGGTYQAIRLKDREVAFYKTTKNKYHIFLCLPYEVKEDEKSGVVGRGANAVLEEWIVDGRREAVTIINRECLTPVRPDKYLKMKRLYR